MQITFQGNPLNLDGKQLKKGDIMPNFSIIKNDLSELKFEQTSGTRIFLAVPSIDTQVCDTEVNKFNKRASEIDGASIYTISMDLPFAQSRWCGANSIDNLIVASDYKNREFAKAIGGYIIELGLLTRAVLIVNDKNEVIYSEYLSEITKEPNYDAAIEAAKK